MKTCAYAGEPPAEPRAHPWIDAVGSAAFRYHDLKASPGLIRTALEDFVPFAHHAAIAQFYALLERLNGPASTLESNDCAFTSAHASELAPPGKLLQCDGRLMILFRDLGRNLSRPGVEALEHALHVRLAALDPGLEHGLIGTTIYPTRYVTLPVAAERQLGHQLMLSFWAWGDDETELMGHLERVVRNLAQAIRCDA